MTDIKNNDDSAILSLIKQKDRQAFGDVFKLYRSNLHRYATLFIQDDQVIEDLIQDIFVKLWFNTDELMISRSVKSYLFRMMHNSCLNYIRHQKVVDKFYKEQAYFGESVSKTHLSDPLLKEALSKAIASLPKLTQDIFILSRVEGFKHEEISQRLAISKKTVEAHLTKATQKLRTELKEFAPVWLPLLIILLQQ